ncbi:MAG: guanine deaminase, partial [Woeseiaceae bacterium]|nr:guanine deaminase [Woeseiaceae bacterium]
MRGYRGTIMHCLSDPGEAADPAAIQVIEDGLLVVDEGNVVETGAAGTLLGKYAGADIADYSGKLIVPGFIDSHVHFPQVDIIASHGEQL